MEIIDSIETKRNPRGLSLMLICFTVPFVILYGLISTSVISHLINKYQSVENLIFSFSKFGFL
jgi:hypothetical protein